MELVITLVFYTYGKAPAVTVNILDSSDLEEYMAGTKEALEKSGYNSYKQEPTEGEFNQVHNWTCMETGTDEEGKSVTGMTAQCVVLVQRKQDLMINGKRELINPPVEEKKPKKKNK